MMDGWIHNTFGLQVQAAQLLEYRTEAELLDYLAKGMVKAPFLHVGAGSNLLFINERYEGTVLHSQIKGMEVTAENDQEVCLRVGAGEVWDDFVAYCVQQNWYGAENLSLIPGEVGASAVQNIGAYGVEVKDLIMAVETIDVNGQKRVFQPAECAYAYRDSIFKRPEMKRYFVTYVHYRLSKVEHLKLDYGTIRKELPDDVPVTLPLVRQTIINIRQRKLPDPKVLGNAGSFFTNPMVSREKWQQLLAAYPDMPYYEVDAARVKIPAGWMIEHCGWKGKALGPAAVHDKQALVLVNLGGASGADIVALSEAVCQAVLNKFGIEIHPEVNFIE
ncbi:MAG: UDP-N-acetylmuramate dehydrogenase [Bacteroidaceae bacterium]|nr:UDP-N-acetylmuramate dehydrogenase [Bacteroidaceae bacterium]